MTTSSSSKQLFFCFLFLLSILNDHFSEASHIEIFKRRQLQREEEHIPRVTHRPLRTTEHDSIDPPTTTLPITNPNPNPNPVTAPKLNAPPTNQIPPVVTIPATNPVTVSPNPVTIPPSTPITLPVNNSPIPLTNPVTTPTTNPVLTPVTTPNPVGGVPGTTTTLPPPAVAGQNWCVAKNGASVTALQAALDYACGIGGADCASIQQGANCYNPSSLQNHASYAFNSYYQKNPVQTSCAFGGAAVLTSTNPSSGSCIYPLSTSLSSSSSPTTNPTPIPTPTVSTTTSPPAAIPTPIPTPTTPILTSPPASNPMPIPTPTTSSTTPPVATNPTPISTPIPTPMTPFSSGSSPAGEIPGAITPPSVLNSSSGFPDAGTTTGIGATPPVMNSSLSSAPTSCQPSVVYLVFLASITTGRLILHM